MKYTRTAVSLHWLIALLFISVMALGVYMTDLPLSPQKLKIYSWHKWAGITILFLSIIRIIWRIKNAAPPLPNSMSTSVKKLAHAGHALLYTLAIAIPLSGWLMSSAKGVQTVWFGVLPLPDLISQNKELGEALLNAHVNLNILMGAVILGHALMAVKHHFIDKDGTLNRMSFINKNK